MRDVALTRPLVLEAPFGAADGAGGHVETWEALGVLWADVRLRGGGDGQAPGIALGRTRLRITVRGAPQGSPRRPVPGQRFRDGARAFRIDAVSEADPAGRYLTCLAEEEVAA
ncbi:hypothetical protein OCGS_2383 [Oceaniovalibus guishaninsula JLT2003]|uniref:Head-tail adaptor n=1 Tax=Oceaniovalibus guishaninsula JLT2003 TaxID=1231392 RepID=K2GLT9_9RHOB|nr:head-tail adaptor protein [Oceaniovalibus guishaninsula]EKE43651.1 hypothetical protein OCGS_2383 [Oceaniovalibus guishaninsula JLT2003]